jgi:hypothetical protein
VYSEPLGICFEVREFGHWAQQRNPANFARAIELLFQFRTKLNMIVLPERQAQHNSRAGNVEKQQCDNGPDECCRQFDILVHFVSS